MIAEYHRSADAGGPRAREELLAAHPQLADALRQYFEDQDEFEMLARPLSPSAARRKGPLPTLRYFGDYELLEEIAQGGMGVVYKARQRSLNRIVAVKMIRSGRLAADDDVKRFHAEAEAAASLQHPNIVTIHEVGEHEGQHYFSMDLVEGPSLADLIREHPLPVWQAAEYIRAAALAIHFAHEQGTLHRDLKPSNILLNSANKVRITDFGLAKRVDGGSELTTTGQILGTPSYMPPEQANAKHDQLGPASDVYALGAILYELITGRPPFRGDTALETLRQVTEDAPLAPRLLNPKLPRDLETICLKCLEKEASKRYPTAELLADDLGRFLANEPIVARRIGWLGRAVRWCQRRPVVAGLSAALAASLLAGFAAVFWQWQRAEDNLLAANAAHVAADRDRRHAVRSQEDAQQQRQRAEQNLATALHAVDKFFADVSTSPELLRGTPGTQELRKKLLEQAQQYYQDFLQQAESNAELAAACAASRYQLGLLAAVQGNTAQAEREFAEAVKLRRQLAASRPDDVATQLDLARALIAHAKPLREMANWKRAQASAQQGVELLQRLQGVAPAEREIIPLLAEGYSELMFTAQQVYAYRDIKSLFGRWMYYNALTYNASSSQPDARLKVAAVLSAYLEHTEQCGWVATAASGLSSTLQSAAPLAERNPRAAEYVLPVARLRRRLGELHALRRQGREASTEITRAQALLNPLAEDDPTSLEMQREYALTSAARGMARHLAGFYDRAYPPLQQAERQLQSLVQANLANESLHVALADARVRLIKLYRDDLRPESARAKLQESLRAITAALARGANYPLQLRAAELHLLAAECALEDRLEARAQTHVTWVLATFAPLIERQPPHWAAHVWRYAEALRLRAEIHARRGELAAAAADLRQAIARWDLGVAEHITERIPLHGRATCLRELAHVLDQDGQRDAATRALDAAAVCYEQRVCEGRPLLPEVVLPLAEICVQRSAWATDAESLDEAQQRLDYADELVGLPLAIPREKREAARVKTQIAAQRAALAERRGDFNAADMAWRTAAAWDEGGEQAALHAGLAGALAQQGRTAEAVVQLELAEQHNRDTFADALRIAAGWTRSAERFASPSAADKAAAARCRQAAVAQLRRAHRAGAFHSPGAAQRWLRDDTFHSLAGFAAFESLKQEVAAMFVSQAKP